VAVRPRVVATDLDGTLLRSDGSLSVRTREAIAAAEAAGIATLFVTGRPPRRLDGLADAVGGHGLAICGNGAFVYDVAAREVVALHGHDGELMASVVADLRSAVPGIVFAVERADGMGREADFVSTDDKPDRRTIGTFEQITTAPVGKLMARLPGAEHDDFMREVLAVVDGRVELAFSGVMGLAEMTPQGITKASGLAAWCEQQGIPASEVWACGDMPNDLPMLAWAGRSFAVENAHPDVLAAATDVIAANDEDGVAQLLESLV
jgi:Cof subfamily protein (haloacid dehalogenase superfamily)